MFFLKRALFLSVLALVSCSNTVQTTVVPIVNPSGEVVFLQPPRFAVKPSTRKSDVQRLTEDVVEALPKNFPSNLVRLDPDQGEAVDGALLLVTASVQEKGKQGETGVLIPIGGMNHLNVPQARIDEAVPSVQTAFYTQLKKHGRLIPMSQLEKKEKKSQ